jgi:peptide/nickel transport system permease protein
MAYPAICRETISVGALYDANIGGISYGDGAIANTTAAGRITPFSQRLHPDVNVDCRTDIFSTGAALAAYSMPTQWLALLMVLYVAGWLGLPTSGVKDPDLEVAQILGSVSSWDVFIDQVRHMILPALAIGIVFAGDYAIITRSALVETMGHDYVLTARAKGLRAWTIVRRHALRNAALPIVTLVALSLGTVVGGVLVVEYVFSYSGIGLVVVQAIEQRDYPVLQGAFLLLTMAVVLANLAADLIYPRLDPRVVLQ